jgi:hypothetical protein
MWAQWNIIAKTKQSNLPWLILSMDAGVILVNQKPETQQYMPPGGLSCITSKKTVPPTVN